jgi:ligand-binding sensor domain-containing protein
MVILFTFIINITVQPEYYTNTNYIYELTGRDSLIYCATNGGVLSYNQAKGTFNVITNSDGLLINRQSCLCLDSLYYVWTGCALGLTVVNSDLSTIQFYPHSLPNSNVQEIVSIRDTIFVGTAGGLLIIDTKGTSQDFSDDVSVILYESHGLPSVVIRSILSSDTLLWVGTDEGIAVFDKNPLSLLAVYTTEDGLLSNHINTIACVDTTVYVGTDFGLNRFVGDHFDTLVVGHEVRDISYAGDSVVLALEAASQIGFYYEGNLSITKNGLPTLCRVSSLVNVQGNIYCGLENRYEKNYYGEGIGSYDFGDAVWHVIKNRCLPSNHITDITANEFGIFVCTGARANESRGFGWLNNDGEWLAFNSDSMLSSNQVHRCATAPDKKVWFGFNTFPDIDSSVMIFSFDPLNNEWNFIQNRFNNMEGTVAVWDMKFDSHNNMYLSVAGPSDKLWVIDSTRTIPYWLPPFQPGYFIEIAIDSAGKIWRTMTDVGVIMTDTKNTLFDRSDDTFHWYTTADGLVSNYTRGCVVAQNNNLYIAADTGLIVYDGTTFTSITNFTNEDLFDIELDSQGRVWMLARDGIYYYEPMVDIVSGWKFSDLGVHIEFLAVSNEIIQVQGFAFDPLRGCFWVGGETGLLKLAIQLDSASVLDDVLVYPNPAIAKNRVRITNIPTDAQVSIYSITGRVMAEDLIPDAVFNEVVWNIPDDAGSGLYFALIKSRYGKKVCKFAIVK